MREWGQRAFILAVMTMLFVLPIVLIPVSTLNPAIQSKEIAAKVLLCVVLPLGILAVPAWRRLADNPVSVAVLLLFSANGLSCAFSSRPVFSIFDSWFIVAMMLIAVMLGSMDLPPKVIHKVMIVIIGTAVIAAIYGLSVYFNMDLLSGFYRFKYKNEADARNYIVSFLGNAEYYGGYMAPIAVLCFSRGFRETRSMRIRVFWIFMTLFFVLNLVLSGTRAALLGFLVGAAIVSVAQFRYLSRELNGALGKLLVGAIVVGASCVVIFSTSNPINYRNLRLAQRFGQILDLNSSSVRERIFFYSTASRLIAKNPLLGTGPGTYKLDFFPGVAALNREDNRAGVMLMTTDLQNRLAEHAHNDYLELWCETGSIGLAALLLTMVALAVRFVRRSGGIGNRGDDSSAELRVLSTGMFAGAACTFFNALFSFPLHMPIRSCLLWVMVGCFISADRQLGIRAEKPVVRKAEGGQEFENRLQPAS
jgi:O-antigen ligase